MYNATWIPESKDVKLEKTWVRQSARFGNVSIISLFRKVSDSCNDYKTKKQERAGK